MQGYWGAYYANSKHPKKPPDIISKLYDSSDPYDIKSKPVPKVSQYEERERRRLQYINEVM